MADPVSKVLDDDDLLIEILLLVGLPTTLVRAATVCRRWFHRVSEPAFLRRFRKLHPPRLLGFYTVAGQFIPMRPQPLELSAVMARASRTMQKNHPCMHGRIMHCRNGSIFLRLLSYNPSRPGVQSMLFPEKRLDVLPPFPPGVRRSFSFGEVHSREDGGEGGGMSYLYVLSEVHPLSTVHVYILRNGVWSMLASATKQFPIRRTDMKSVLVSDKIYMAAYRRDIIVFNLTTSTFSIIQLPQGVNYGNEDTMLSEADDHSGVYLVQKKKLQIRIWLYTGDLWLLVDTICLHDMCANLEMLDCTTAQIKHLGDNADFLFLLMDQSVLYLDIKCRTLHHVYEMTRYDQIVYCDIYPLKMIWPPAFPTLQD